MLDDGVDDECALYIECRNACHSITATIAIYGLRMAQITVRENTLIKVLRLIIKVKFNSYRCLMVLSRDFSLLLTPKPYAFTALRLFRS